MGYGSDRNIFQIISEIFIQFVQLFCVTKLNIYCSKVWIAIFLFLQTLNVIFEIYSFYQYNDTPHIFAS